MKLRDSWSTTVWLCLNVVIARFLAKAPTWVFVNDLEQILMRSGWMPPADPLKPVEWKAHLSLLIFTVVFNLIVFIVPLVWVWPIGRYIDTADEDLRPIAVKRFCGINRFFIALTAAVSLSALVFAVSERWATPAGPSRAPFGPSACLILFESYYYVYFLLLALEPLLFKELARWLYPGETVYERKAGPMWSVRTKLLLLVLNLVVIPMTLVAASMRFGLTGFSTGLGVAVLTAVIAIGYTEMLYQGLALPLSELNRKMASVASGDYRAKTTVYADDEIGEVKWHFNEMIDGLAERERLKDTFGRFVSIEIAKRLIETDKIALGGENIEATVLFSDIRDFTPLSESMTPQELVSFLNSYFSFITAPIQEHRGVVNKFIGDAVMAIFAEQFGSKDHAADALAAARAMRLKLAEFNASRPGAKPVRFGVGVHTGLLVAGNIGTEKRMEYTVIGDTVNVAARIESKTKDLGSDLLVSDSVFSRLSERTKSGIKAERCEGVHVKGKDAPLVVYKID